jgi:two-component system, cell cycle sensor histidine kinase and response regulator CckA
VDYIGTSEERFGKIVSPLNKMTGIKILHVEDSPHDAELVRIVLIKEWPASSVRHVDTLAKFQAALVLETYDLILADYNLPGFKGQDVLRAAQEFSLGTPVIFLTGAISEETAFDLIREGANDYVFKHRLERLTQVIPRALQERDERRRRLKAEAELRESESRFRSIFLSMVEGVVLLDADGRIISANPSAQRILGFEVAEELLGSFPAWRAIRENLSPFGANDLPWAVARRTGKAEPNTVMGIYQAKGALVWVVANAQPFQGATNKECPLVVTLNDITEKKSLEAQFLRAQRLESLGLLAAGVAHDLNNILAPLLMGVPILRDRTTQPNDQRLLNTMEKSAVRGADLVRQILGFTRGIDGSTGLVQLRHIARELVALLEATLPKSIHLDHDLSADTWPVCGNPTQLHQVLLNLSVNARDAMPKGGTLRITIANERLDVHTAHGLYSVSPGPYVHIAISDTGSGIEPDVLSRIWEPFFTTKGPEKGTGLGLSTVRGIVQSHHGCVDVETTLGKGTTFHILLPADERSVALTEAKSSSPLGQARGHGELILIVDDETEIREIATSLLSVQGYRVLAAKDGMQAYSQLLQHGSDIRLLITDLGMPELDGSALCIMARRQFPDIQIIVMSGKGSAVAVDAGYKDHSDAFLQKPFLPDVLLNAVDELISRKRV